MFKFELEQRVSIIESGEAGSVIGRAEFTHAEPTYYVRYKDGTGKAVESWWSESALEVAE